MKNKPLEATDDSRLSTTDSVQHETHQLALTLHRLRNQAITLRARSHPFSVCGRRMGARSIQPSRPTIEYSNTFAAIAIVYITTMVSRSGGPSSAIKMNELGQSMSSTSPNEWSTKYQRSKRTAGTTKPASPHPQIQFFAVSFILPNITPSIVDVTRRFRSLTKSAWIRGR